MTDKTYRIWPVLLLITLISYIWGAASALADIPRPPPETHERGSLSINTQPWTEVVIDGRKIGNTPVVKHSLSVGKHCVQLVNEQLEIDESVGVIIKKGEHSRISRRFNTVKETGMLTVLTNPWSEVFINNIKVGITPVLKHRLEPGIYIISLVNRHIGVNRTVRVEINRESDTRIIRNLKPGT